MNDVNRLIENLGNASVYSHSVDNIEIIETHISWVILTGTYVYKIKKAVNLGFLDFSTLDKRHYYCLEELRLNKRLEPEIYLDVIAFTGTYHKPSINGDGPVLEWAVRMLQFDCTQQFDHLLDKGLLQPAHLDSLAKRIITFHNSLPRSSAESGFGDAISVHKPVCDNYTLANRLTHSGIIKEKLKQLSCWHEEEFITCKPRIDNRKNNGFVRECHGDLHLANIALHNNTIIIFDCIEFNESLRQIDVINEISFLLMDLHAHERKDLGNHFINYWLQASGDYEGLGLLRYYSAYRAMVRAKVAIIEASQKTGGSQLLAEQRANMYLDLTYKYTLENESAIILTHGLSGSGKSTISARLAGHINALYVRSDIERKRLFADNPDDIYNESANRKTYHRLGVICEYILQAGYSALVDATFLKQDKRQAFISLATELGVPCIILDFHAPRELLEQWLIERAEEGNDPSDADIKVLDMQIKNQEPLTDTERGLTISIDTSQVVDIQLLATKIQLEIHRRG